MPTNLVIASKSQENIGNLLAFRAVELFLMTIFHVMTAPGLD
jgi:hypothetical protein